MPRHRRVRATEPGEPWITTYEDAEFDALLADYGLTVETRLSASEALGRYGTDDTALEPSAATVTVVATVRRALQKPHAYSACGVTPIERICHARTATSPVLDVPQSGCSLPEPRCRSAVEDYVDGLSDWRHLELCTKVEVGGPLSAVFEPDRPEAGR